MHLITGFAALLSTALLWIKYRPKSLDGRLLCLIAAVMGAMSLMAGGGNTFFQGFNLVMLAVVEGCCLVQLHREKRYAGREEKRNSLPRTARPRREKSSRRRVTALDSGGQPSYTVHIEQ
jgi:hypothetical protein